jgi:hypothetical protein
MSPCASPATGVAEGTVVDGPSGGKGARFFWAWVDRLKAGALSGGGGEDAPTAAPAFQK